MSSNNTSPRAELVCADSLANESGTIRFDEQPVPGATLDDLEPALWQRFASARISESREVLLEKLAMARMDHDGVLRPTVAGILMASKDPRRWLPCAFIQAVSYRGNEIDLKLGRYYQIDAKDITGPLDQQILAACLFVEKNMRVGAIKNQGRLDVPQFDLNAVFEALVNACAHRDYSIHGAKIRLRLFANRLELYSPGAIPNTMTVESLPYRQAARNEAITSLLAKCKLAPDEVPYSGRNAMMDKRGEGVQIILDATERLAGKRPMFQLIDASELLLTIPAAGEEFQAYPKITTLITRNVCCNILVTGFIVYPAEIKTVVAGLFSVFVAPLQPRIRPYQLVFDKQLFLLFSALVKVRMTDGFLLGLRRCSDTQLSPTTPIQFMQVKASNRGPKKILSAPVGHLWSGTAWRHWQIPGKCPWNFAVRCCTFWCS